MDPSGQNVSLRTEEAPYLGPSEMQERPAEIGQWMATLFAELERAEHQAARLHERFAPVLRALEVTPSDPQGKPDTHTKVGDQLAAAAVRIGAVASGLSQIGDACEL